MAQAGLDTLKTCQKALTVYQSIVDSNKELEKYNTNLQLQLSAAWSVWDQKKKNYESDLRDWQNMTGKFNSWGEKKRTLENERKDWRNCVSWDQTTPGARNGWCEGEFGSGWAHLGQTGSGCTWGFGKGQCGRTAAEVTRQLDSDGYQRAKPTFDDIEPKEGQGLYVFKKYLPNDTNIQCCANIMNTPNANVENVRQSCEQRITQLIQEASQPAQVLPAPQTQIGSGAMESIPEVTPNETETNYEQTEIPEQSKPQADYNQQIIIGIVVLLVFLGMSSSLFSVVLVSRR